QYADLIVGGFWCAKGVILLLHDGAGDRRDVGYRSRNRPLQPHGDQSRADETHGHDDAEDADVIEEPGCEVILGSQTDGAYDLAACDYPFEQYQFVLVDVVAVDIWQLQEGDATAACRIA